MQKKEYRKRIEDWLSCQDTGMGIREGFLRTEHCACSVLKEASLCYAGWLILPGEEAAAGLPQEAALEWNRILLSVFSRTGSYRQEERVLWDRLRNLSGQIFAYMEEEKQGCFLVGGSVPEMEERLVGRERELELAAKRLKEEGAVFLYGIGGIGKSAVARAYVHRYGARYDRIVYASCEEGLRELFADDRRIPVRHMAYMPSGKRGEMGWYVRNKLKVLKETTDERTLLVIDNFDRVHDPLLKQVLGLPCHILFTTRTNPACFGKTGIEIRAFEDKEKLVELFAAYCGSLKEGEEEAVLALLGQFRGHTLCTKLLASYCRTKQIRPSRLLAVADVLKESIFNLSALPPKERQILRNAALLPVAGMGLERFLCLSGGLQEHEVHTLSVRGLIEYDTGSRRISLHPLVRKEVIEGLGVSWYACRKFIGNFKKELAGFWDMPMAEKMGFLSYVLGILDTLPLTDAHRMDDALFLSDLLWQMGQWSYAIRHTEALYEECRRVFGSTHPYTAHAAHLVASVFHNRREKEKAACWYERAYLAYRDWQEKEPCREGLYLMKYNRCFALRGEYGKADALLREAEALYLAEIEAGQNVGWMKSSLQNTYIEHTRLFLAQEKYEEALYWCRKADGLCGQLGGSKTTKAYILHDEAVARLHLGDLGRAGECLRTAWEYAQEYLAENQPERLEIEKAWRSKEWGNGSLFHKE